jgi:FG-GAP-like repeat
MRSDDVAAADYNGDGTLDLVLGAEDRVLIFTGNGDGTFLRAGELATEPKRLPWRSPTSITTTGSISQSPTIRRTRVD